jgi:hypothetical protein
VAVKDQGQAVRDWVAKIVIGEIEEIGAATAARAGARVDGDAKELAGAVDENLVVRRATIRLDLAVDDATGEQGVRILVHGSPTTTNDRRGGSAPDILP